MIEKYRDNKRKEGKWNGTTLSNKDRFMGKYEQKTEKSPT